MVKAQHQTHQRQPITICDTPTRTEMGHYHHDYHGVRHIECDLLQQIIRWMIFRNKL